LIKCLRCLAACRRVLEDSIVYDSIGWMTCRGRSKGVSKGALRAFAPYGLSGGEAFVLEWTEQYRSSIGLVDSPGGSSQLHFLHAPHLVDALPRDHAWLFQRALDVADFRSSYFDLLETRGLHSSFLS
jgi:hypothetical protein